MNNTRNMPRLDDCGAESDLQGRRENAASGCGFGPQRAPFMKETSADRSKARVGHVPFETKDRKKRAVKPATKKQLLSI